MKMILVTIDQSLFYLGFQKYFRKLCLKDFSIIAERNLFHQKKCGFQQRNSTKHAIIHLINQTNDKFKNNCFHLGLFVDLSKEFETVNHQVLISKLKNYEVEAKNLILFKSHLKNCKQYLNYTNDVTNFSYIKRVVLQGSILGPLLFLIYVSDLCNASDIFDSIMFADNTHYFLSRQNIKTLFKIFNEKLK